MPTNEFDLSVRPEYVSNRLAIPFNELNAMAAQHQKEYDNAEDSAYKFKDLMASVKAIHDPSLGLSNIAAKDALYSNYAPRIEAISNEIAKGNNISEATRKLSQLQREWNNDPTRVELENSYGNYTKYVEDIIKKGDKYAIYKDKYRNTLLVDEKGNLKQFRYSGMGDIQDHATESRNQMKDIAIDGYDFKNSYLAPDGNIYTKDSHGKYVKDDKVKRIAYIKRDSFLATKEGQDYLEFVKYYNPNASPEQLYNQIGDYLYKAGINQVFRDVGGGNDVDVTGLSIARDKEKQDKIAQQASTTPEILNLRDNGELSTVMPSGLSKFYKGDKLDLTNNLSAGDKEAGDRIANTGGFLNLGLISDKSSSVNKNAIEYTNQLFDNAAKILNISKKDIAEIYKSKNNENKKDPKSQDGYTWLKQNVEGYYINLTLQKNTVATLQAPEQATATSFFLGDNVPKDDANSAIGSNIRSSEITDLKGNQIIDKKGINSNNFTTSSIGFEKPGQVVLSGNDGSQLLMNTNYETFKKITKPVVDIVKNSDEFKKTFELTDDQKSRLGSKKPLESILNIDGNKIHKTQFDKQQFNIGNTFYSIDSYLIRENNGQPMEYHYIREQDQETGKMSENTLTADQLKVKFANAIINSPEFRGLNKQKENKVSFDNQ